MRKTEHFDFFTLPNGMRIVHRKMDAAVAHAGIIIEAGCRHEEEHEHGIAHFIEHCLFKGTEKRNAFKVFSCLEDVGGDLNAYTAREETFIYASFLPQYYERAVELFEDILRHSVFPEKEIAKEKSVVLEEINSYKDNPYEMIYDDFDEKIFNKHALGRNILGTEKTINTFTPDHLRKFIARLYRPEKMVLCSVGNISGKELQQLAMKYFDGAGLQKSDAFKGNTDLFNPFPVQSYKAFSLARKKRTFQTHCIIGNLAYSYKDPKRLAFSLLVNVLGGPAMSSRLNMSIRERHGHAYQVESMYTPFQETGVFTTYLGTDTNKLDASLSLFYKELNKVCNNRLTRLQLQNAKQQFIGQVAINLEVNVNQMLSIGKSYLIYDRVDTFNEIVDKVEKLTASDLMEVANEIFDPQKMSTLTYLSKP
ncbi:MAG: M16 family metallopeptidase [Bacteroidales bacterium]